MMTPKHDLYLIMEYLPLDLEYLMRSTLTGTILEPDHITIILYNALIGLKNLHSMGLIHRDIKPSSILVDKDC